MTKDDLLDEQAEDKGEILFSISWLIVALLDTDAANEWWLSTGMINYDESDLWQEKFKYFKSKKDKESLRALRRLK